ncbi:hypothetical protein [Pseudogracilibacillus sp. SO30301A]|uniref:hypothetical protein n=1 Tax=Pseudogracilibacillus sp. SO30301A TaxID=3098291 RepID=UPI00300DF8F5
MNITLIHRLLTGKNIKIIATDTSLQEDLGPWENHYKLRFKDGKWEFVFVQWEKSDGREKVLKYFDNEETASKFFYLYQLKKHYFYQYIRPFTQRNEDINVGTRQFNFENLKEALERLDIPGDYYSLHGELKKHSIVLEKINERESKVKIIWDNNEVIRETLILENWEAYDEFYKMTYYIHLLSHECQRLIEEKIIHKRFTNEEYSIFLSPGV